MQVLRSFLNKGSNKNIGSYNRNCLSYAKNKEKENNKMGKLKYDAIRIAKQLCYKPEIIARIQNAKTESEIYRILKTAREEL